jgi:predicted ATPase/DNA-binding SARP family transcriptional activator
MPSLALSFLGAPLIALDQTPSTAPMTAKAQALLAYLAIEADRPHRREALAALFWPDLAQDAARNNLRQTLHQLRRALSEGCPPLLLATAQTIQFNIGSDHWMDVSEFTMLIRTCQEHGHRRCETCRACIERLERATTLYRGELLSGLYLTDSVAFEEWVMVKREQLARMALAAWHSLAEYYARRGDYELMEQAARQQIAIDPFREDAHRQVMQALAWSGHRNAALAHYAAYCRMLEKELGAQPEKETVALHEHIQAETLPLPKTPSALDWPAWPRITPLIGRDRELAQLAEYLQTPGLQLVTLVGPGGVGKTRLALQAASQEAFAFHDGACFAPLESISSSEFMAAAIAAAVRLTLSGPTDPLSQLLNYLRDKEMLLVLDNLEHLAAGAAELAVALLTCPRLTLLATSRVPLRVRGEQQFPVQPLATPNLDQLGPCTQETASALSSYPAVTFFVERSRAARPDFALTVDNAAAVAEICARLDGLPLAIELAAAHSRMFLPQVMLTQLADLPMLMSGLRDLPARQQTLRRTMDWSYSLLNADEQKLLARLAVFRGGCTLDAIATICCDDISKEPSRPSPAVSGIESLRDKSLIQYQERIEDASRFTMLETIRQYTTGRLEQNGELEAIRAQHAAYYLALAEQAASEMSGPQQVAWLERLEIEHDNLRAALRWALDGREIEIALRLGGTLWRFWYWRGHLGEGRRWLAEALALAGARWNDQDQPSTIAMRATALRGAGMLASAQDDYAQAVALMEANLELARKIQDKANVASTLVWLGSLAYDHGERERSQAFYHDGMALCRELGAAGRRPLAFVLDRLGETARHQGDHTTALAFHQESLALWRELGSRDGIACALCNLGFLAHIQGDDAQATSCFREGLALTWELKDKRDIAETMAGLVVVAGAQGQFVRAAQLSGQIEALLTSIGASLDLAEYEKSLADVCAGLGAAAFEVTRAKGRAMTLEEAVAYALAAEH